jgi:Zn-finger protein
MKYKYFSNPECEFYPCHTVLRVEDFSCIHCFCPLFPVDCWDEKKNCKECVYPHIASNYEPIIAKLTIEHLKRCHKKRKS